MKSLKRLLLLLLSLLFCGYAYGMNPVKSVKASVKTYILPGDQEVANHEFLELLDDATDEVLVAMYWITDDFVVDRLIEVQEKGVNVEVIFDESSQNRDVFMRKFLNNGITPIIFPSGFTESLMHNKFLVIDGSTVWTGSANFTKKAFDPSSERFNHENIIVIDSDKVAKNYIEGFYAVKADAVNSYIQILMASDNFPEFVRQLSLALYADDEEFEEVIGEKFRSADQTQKARLLNYFPDLEPFERPMDYQKDFLQKRGLFRDNMSFDEASQLMGEIKKQGRGAVKKEKSPVKTPPTPQRPANKEQREFLKALDIDASKMSYEQAEEQIKQLVS